MEFVILFGFIGIVIICVLIYNLISKVSDQIHQRASQRDATIQKYEKMTKDFQAQALLKMRELEVREKSKEQEFRAKEQKLAQYKESLDRVKEDLDRMKPPEEPFQSQYEKARDYVTWIKDNNIFYTPEQKREYLDRFHDARFDNALVKQIIYPTSVSISAKMPSQSKKGTVYITTLDSCTCTDYQTKHKPCKHMIALAVFTNSVYNWKDDVKAEINTFIDTKNKISLDKQEIKRMFEEADSRIEEADRRLKKAEAQNWEADVRLNEAKCKLERALESAKATVELAFADKKEEFNVIESAIAEKEQTYPWIADIIASYRTAKYEMKMRSNLDKSQMKAELKKREKQIAMLENQMAVWKYQFPILDEVSDIAPEDLGAIMDSAGESRFTYQWLDKDEYSILTSPQKQQKWIEKYFHARSRSSWEAGIKYERYIGYLCELEGASVKYNGAIMKKDDMGRDLIVKHNSQTFLIQCKRYSKEKEIHENSIFQLYGSLWQYKKNNHGEKIHGVFVTTTSLSEVARECAKALKIKVYENVDFKDYPIIKCNIGRDGERIYHMPYDQQYDSIKIEPNKGEMYVSTVEEAENNGFRHAYRHFD